MNLSESKVLNKLRKIDEYDFEELVADVWEERGWSTTVTTGSGDRGIDVIAEKQNPFTQKQLIQAKRYSADNKISSPDIQQYDSLRRQEDDVDAVVVVTTSSFSKQAKQLARDLNVKTINGSDFYNMIVEIENTDILKQYIHIRERDTGNSGSSEKNTSNNDCEDEKISENSSSKRSKQVFDAKSNVISKIPATDMGASETEVVNNSNPDQTYSDLTTYGEDNSSDTNTSDTEVVDHNITIAERKNPDYTPASSEQNPKSVAHQMAKDANSDFHWKVLFESSARTDKKAFDYLVPNEKVKAVLKNHRKGLKIISPNGGEKEPHNKSTSSDRYLIITNKQICYIPYLDVPSSIQTYDYVEITDVFQHEIDKLVGSYNIFAFSMSDGTEYRFDKDLSAHCSSPEDAIDYLQSRIV